MFLPQLPSNFVSDFKRLFGVSVGQFWNRMEGLDILKLDDLVIHSPDDKSMEDAAIETFGKEAAELIEKMIAWEFAFISGQSAENSLEYLRSLVADEESYEHIDSD